MKIVIIGGGAGGASVAARTRRLDESAEIFIFDKHAHISQATCGMPYYLGDVIKDRSRLLVTDEEEFSKILNITVHTRSEVIAINREAKYLVSRNLDSGEIYKQTYDKLVLATGGSPAVPDIPGINSDHVFTLNNLYDMDQIKNYIDNNNCKNAVVIGAGLIGLEVADNLHKLNMKVQVIESSKQAFGALDFEMASLIHQHLAHNKINLLLNETVTSVDKSFVSLKSEKIIKADIVIVSVGVKPNVGLAYKCFLKTGRHGGISVNSGLHTSTQDIYALGDNIEVDSLISNEKTLVQLAGHVHKQAQVIADNLTGGHESYKPVQGNSIARVLDLTIAITGYSEQKLKQENISYKKSYIDVPSHAVFYPGSAPLVIKLMFAANTGRILGAQIIGTEGVDKRIDVIASAIQFEKTVYDLADLELAYAPPYSSAKDPVNIAGMVAKNMLRDGFNVVYWDEISKLQKEGAAFIDVRTPEEHNLQALPGSLNIPLEELRDRLKEIPANNKIIIYCSQGKKSYFAWRMLSQIGYDNIQSLSGGYKIYLCATKNHHAELIRSEIRARSVDNLLARESGQEKVIPLLNPDATPEKEKADLLIDATGLCCPGPILQLTKGIKKINDGQYLLIKASDASFFSDVDSWCSRTGNKLYSRDTNNSVITALIQKKM